MGNGRPASPRDLRDFLDRKTSGGPHLPPGRAHLRAKSEDYRAQAPPEAPFRYKLKAFLQNQVAGWVWSYLKFRFGPRHRFQTYRDTPGDGGVYRLAGDSYFGAASPDEEIRISVAGDWATGTDESNRIAGQMVRFEPHYTIHLGDVYFVGDQEEVETNCLGKAAGNGQFRCVTWPLGSVGSFALNGNHEMYANGNAYFDTFLPALGIRKAAGGEPGGQKASFFCLRNEYWDVLALDTGYNSVGLPLLEKLPFLGPNCKLPNELMAWLRDTVKPGQSGRGLVLMSHHQYYSAFDEMYAKPAKQLASLIERPVLWLWGHEHRMAIYGPAQNNGGIKAYGRCVGHGGMPVDIGIAPQREEFPLVLYDDRTYMRLDGEPVGFNGIANLTFRRNTLAIEYRDILENLLLREEWEVDNGALSGKRIERGVQDPKLVAVRDLQAAIGL